MKKNDVILILSILLIAGVVFGLISLIRQEEGGQAEVYIDGEQTASYPLDQNGEYEITTRQGRNLLVIQEGKVYVTEADCPDKLCVKQRSISKKGETIVCLPHKVVVEISGGAEKEMDAITR